MILLIIISYFSMAMLTAFMAVVLQKKKTLARHGESCASQSSDWTDPDVLFPAIMWPIIIPGMVVVYGFSFLCSRMDNLAFTLAKRIS